MKGIPELLDTVNQVATGQIKCKPHRIRLKKSVNKAVESLSRKIEGLYPNLPNTRWIAMRLLDGDSRVIDALEQDEFKLNPQDGAA